MFVLPQRWAAAWASCSFIFNIWVVVPTHPAFPTQIFLLLPREGERVGGAKVSHLFLSFFHSLDPSCPARLQWQCCLSSHPNCFHFILLSFFSLPFQLSTYTCQDAFLFLCSHHCLFYCLSSPGLIWSLSWPSHLSVCVSLCVPSFAPLIPPSDPA